MDKYSEAYAKHRRRKWQAKVMAEICFLWMLLGFVLGVAFWMAVVNVLA